MNWVTEEFQEAILKTCRLENDNILCDRRLIMRKKVKENLCSEFHARVTIALFPYYFLGARFTNTGVSFYQTIPPGDLADAIKAKTPNIHFGLYHSLLEWFNPLYLRDKEANFTTNDFVMTKTLQELYELVRTPFPVTTLKRQSPRYYTVLSRHTHKAFAYSQ